VNESEGMRKEQLNPKFQLPYSGKYLCSFSVTKAGFPVVDLFYIHNTILCMIGFISRSSISVYC